MQDKTKNIVIIVLSILLTASVTLNIIRLRPKMPMMPDNNMMGQGQMQMPGNNRQFNRPDRSQNDTQNEPQENQEVTE